MTGRASDGDEGVGVAQRVADAAPDELGLHDERRAHRRVDAPCRSMSADDRCRRSVRARKTSSSVGAWTPTRTSSTPWAASVSRASRRTWSPTRPSARGPRRRPPCRRRPPAPWRARSGSAEVQHEDVGADACLQLGGRALGHQPATVEHADAVGQLVGLLEVLRREEDRDAGCRQLLDAPPERLAAARVEPGRRLVEEQHGRDDDEADGEVQAPAHPARVRPRTAGRRRPEVEPGEQLVGPAPRRRVGAARRCGPPSPGSRGRSAARRRPSS